MPSYRYKTPREYGSRAKELRRQAPKPERILWNALSFLRVKEKVHFRRQHPLPPYIADFACIKARLVIELDGPSHDTRVTYDAQRQANIERRGWTIIRFSNEDVINNLEGVVLTILEKTKTE